MSEAWSEGLDSRAGNRDTAEAALLELYDSLGVARPKKVVWLASPFQGLLAHAYLQHRFGESLIPGDEPRLLHAMMAHHVHWNRTKGHNRVHPNPAWTSLPVGRRVEGRAKLVKELLTETAHDWLKGESLCPKDVEAVLGALDPSTSRPNFFKAVPGAIKALGVHPGWSSPGYVRTFAYDVQTWSGDAFTLRSPRCMNTDELAATVHEVDRLSQTRPKWLEPLRQLVTTGGWIWPFDEIAVCCDRPNISHYNEDDLLHNLEGEALGFPDGRTFYLCEGQVMTSVITTPQKIEPALVNAEQDLEKKRILIRLRGPETLDDPAWPANLKTLARMVFERQYQRYTQKALRGRAKLWPRSGAELNTEGPVEETDGCYFTLHPDGQLDRVVSIVNGKWAWDLRLSPGIAEGFLKSGSFAEKYFPDGRLEHFSPYDDHSQPEPTWQTFQAWVQAAFDKLLDGRAV